MDPAASRKRQREEEKDKEKEKENPTNVHQPQLKRPFLPELRRSNTVDYIRRDEERQGTDQMRPINAFVTPLLTDLYQLSMAYAYWKSGKQDEPAVFDLFFRKNPFNGEFTIFAGLEEVIRFISSFNFRETQIEQVRALLPSCEEGFFSWLATVDCSKLKVYALQEGTLVFPRIPMIRVEGPLAVGQLLETTLLTLVNFPSLVATNAARHRLAAGPDKVILEFGLRRAQGPDGAISASRYSYIGGCDGTSNVLAGILFGMPVKGTHAHAFVSSFLDENDLQETLLPDLQTGEKRNLKDLVWECRKELKFLDTNDGELAAFTAYAGAFPHGFLALVDTYDTLKSGVPNFLCVAYALHILGYKALGVRLDSGDLAYLSIQTRKLFQTVAKKTGIDYFIKFSICASNDINEATLVSLNAQEHEIDTFGIGTNLVTCQAQPALGCVYKLVETRGTPRIKLSQEISKVTLPGKKEAYRLYSESHIPILDLLVPVGSPPPVVGQRILCRHPFEQKKRAYVTPAEVVPLHHLVWDQGKVVIDLPSLEELKQRVQKEIKTMRNDYLRLLNPTPYKVSVTDELYNFIHELWLKEAPIPDLSNDNKTEE